MEMQNKFLCLCI